MGGFYFDNETCLIFVYNKPYESKAKFTTFFKERIWIRIF